MAAGASRHGPVAQLLIAWSPLSLILVAYAVAGWVSAPLGADVDATNRLGFEVALTWPAQVDRTLLGGVPTVWLQQHLVDGTTHWYDAAAALVYSTHFVAIPLLTAYVWFALRDRFVPLLASLLVFTVVGMTGYVVSPAAPPWLASQRGEIGPVERVSHLGWEHLHLDWISVLTVSGQSGSNPVAAMPSLHAGSAMLVALVLWPVLGAAGRTLALGYVLVMGLTLVYTGEHYVVDVVAGWLTAAAAACAGVVLARLRRTGRWPAPRPALPRWGPAAPSSRRCSARRVPPTGRPTASLSHPPGPRR
ncbi:membrane-associated phospholipid phosphatase [Nocardioides marinisabuli]|uniref:Membrane-associated phospholipid phosphatase n=1 Tax=Nocardioides marinisabuli TaxID=419476 RepID=A0A7Y9F281_9ACTN|nr:phosphatase PAP2 family protein [Nocardioides marinisabuli]NYD58290.1 membrane-associated phospholipid phosphatase [Nocardioides marinisabuli]